MSIPHLSRRGLFGLNGAGCGLASVLLVLSDPPGASQLPATIESPASGKAVASNSTFKPIAPGVFELDRVRLDTQRRTVNFPALVNMREGNLEYLIVTTTGKTHESLLRTEVKPFQIQLALLLLGAKGTTNPLPEDPGRPLPGDPVEIELSWKTAGKTRRIRAEELVTDRKAGGAMSRGHWIYNGSRLREDGFAAQVDGSIVSLITDADALINNPRPGREDDDNWLPRPKDLPPLNSSVEVWIRLRLRNEQ